MKILNKCILGQGIRSRVCIRIPNADSRSGPDLCRRRYALSKCSCLERSDVSLMSRCHKVSSIICNHLPLPHLKLLPYGRTEMHSMLCNRKWLRYQEPWCTLLTAAFFGTAYTSLTTLVSDGGGGSGSSGCEYCIKHNIVQVYSALAETYCKSTRTGWSLIENRRSVCLRQKISLWPRPLTIWPQNVQILIFVPNCT